MPLPANDQAPPRIELRPSGDFVEWLAASQGALAVTTYNSGKLAFITAPAGELIATISRLPRPMGVAFDAGRLAVSTQEQLWLFAADANRPGSLSPEKRYEIGRLDAHDVAFGDRGLFFVNTRFNCIARPSERVNFIRHWQPPFVDRTVRRDACHLNGLGMRDGRPTIVTAFSAAGHAGAWRAADRFSSGVLVDVRRNQIVAWGLCMPHSPRWHDGRWWFCNSGEGSLNTVDDKSGAIRTVTSLPGFTRGLCFAHGRAVVGLSRIRRRHVLDSPRLGERFPRSHSGLSLVDPGDGRETGRLEFVLGGREVYDAAFLPGWQAVDIRLDSPDSV